MKLKLPQFCKPYKNSVILSGGEAERPSLH